MAGKSSPRARKRGAMEGESKRTNMRSLVEAIKASDALDTRISLISQLEDSCQSETSDLAFLIQHLTWTFWMESACSGIPQCVLNKKILIVAAKYLESVESSYLIQFLILGTKASVWCRKHLQMTVESIEGIEDENHSVLFLQLILDCLSFSSVSVTTLTRSPIIGGKVEMLVIEDFIFEQLNLTKASVLEIKKIRSSASEVLKVAQVVLDGVIKLCRAYSQAIKLSSLEFNNRNEGPVDDYGVDCVSHVANITACTIENLYELGTFAASGGGSLVSLLNLSWKGVVSLLHLSKGFLVDQINVGDIILGLVSLVTESLRGAAEAWTSYLTETVAIVDAKRSFLPIKFFLINAVRISSEFPHEAVAIYREITRCLLTISTLGILWSNEMHLRPASEALAELVEPTAFVLLHTLLNSADVEAEARCQIVDSLFSSRSSDPMDLEGGFYAAEKLTTLDGIFTESSDDVTGTDILVLGRVMVFLNLLKTSPVLREEVVVSISRKLDCLLDFLMHEDVYSSILGLQVPVSCGSGAPGIAWQFMVSFILHALRTFMIVATSTSLAWMEVETFLLTNFLHPHFLCLEVVIELWRFLFRHAEVDLVHHLIDRLYLLLKIIASSDSSLDPLSPLRNMARSICMLLSRATPATLDQVYSFILRDIDPQQSSVMYTALLMEGFPLVSLSDNLKRLAIQKIFSEFKELEPRDCSSPLLCLPAYALSSVLVSGQTTDPYISDENLTSQALKFALSLIHGYKYATESMKASHAKLLSAALDIISNVKLVDAADVIGKVILELEIFSVACSADSDAFSYHWKPSCASLMAKLCHMELAEGEENAICSALYRLYHELLRERHWAFVHLAIAAFGYFAARTSWTELWRFVPQDAALSYDIDTGDEANEDRFMTELKAYLEKEAALSVVIPCKKQLSLLAKEGMVLKKNCKSLSIIPNVPVAEKVTTNVEDRTKPKKRKLPEGISEGMELLQDGLKLMSNALAQADSGELKEAFSTHISCLEDVISHIVSLSNMA